MTNAITTDEKVKSVRLTREQMAAFKKVLSSYHTKVKASEGIGISRQSIDNILLRGTCGPESLIKINNAINVPA